MQIAGKHDIEHTVGGNSGNRIWLHSFFVLTLWSDLRPGRFNWPYTTSRYRMGRRLNGPHSSPGLLRDEKNLFFFKLIVDVIKFWSLVSLQHMDFHWQTLLYTYIFVYSNLTRNMVTFLQSRNVIMIWNKSASFYKNQFISFFFFLSVTDSLDIYLF